jgi:dipeptidyl aminopeptidase/acylaminoacyl peptidase
LVDRGFRILSLDYRGSAGHGAAYVAAGNGEYDSGMVSDVLAGGRWLVRDGCARLREACETPTIVMGDSFGAYLAQAAVIREPDLFAGVVSLSGLSDLSDRQALTSRFARSEGTYLAEVLDFAGADSVARLARASPAGRDDEIRVPALYVHARDDDRVPFEQSAIMVEQLVARGERAHLLAIPTGGHSLQCADCADVVYEGVGDFIDSIGPHTVHD